MSFERSIAPFVATCLRAFAKVTAANSTSNDESRDIISAQLEDQLGKFRVWAGNIGAHQRGNSSLDFRLRDDSEIKGQVVRILENLLTTLHDARDLCASEDTNSSTDSSDDSEQQVTFADDNEPPIERALSSISDHIRCLYRMTMLIRKPAQSDFVRQGDATEMKAFWYFDFDVLRTKYPGAEPILLMRLARASSRRRGYLQYRSRHHAKLRQGLDQDVDDISEAMSSTVPTAIQRELSTDNDAASIIAMSETSFATSMLSESSNMMPKRPREASNGDPFECPYCFCIITAANMHDWARHVCDDIRPYVCTFLDCPWPLSMYASRHQWQAHIENCHVGNPQSCDYGSCPLCGDSNVFRTWISHVARHLQEIALFAIRNDPDGDGSSDSASISCHDDASSGDEQLVQGRKEAKAFLQPEQKDVIFDRAPKPRPQSNPVDRNWKKLDHILFIRSALEHGTDWQSLARDVPSKNVSLVSLPTFSNK